MANLAVSVAPATAPAERAATKAFATMSGVMAAAIVPQVTREGEKITVRRGGEDFGLRPGPNYPVSRRLGFGPL